MKIIRTAFFLVFFVATVVGCGIFRRSVSKEFSSKQPRSIAIMPVQGEYPSDIDPFILNRLIERKLKELGYETVLVLDISDTNAGMRQDASSRFARRFDSDAVLFTNVEKWDTKSLMVYASLKIKATFELYGRSGNNLWRSRYKVKKSDIALDRSLLHLSVIGIYKPLLVNLVDIAFSTLPPYGNSNSDNGRSEKEYFRWLP